ncbi:MAG: DUF58 domain-containing protein [Elusimicrobia bacterium]|jgi:uncharacterized protein (DUF58 family)|nr:DUF58 domain-containing protein [Elusimicrobiota bacterium]
MNTQEIIKKVKNIEIRTGKLVSESFAGQYLSVFKGKGVEFAEVREYVVGDDIRTIDWNITARTSKVYVKKFNEERELTVMVASDVSASGLFGTRNKTKNELSAELAALFMFAALKNNDKTGLFLFSDNTELYVPPKKGKNHILRIVRDMIAFKPKSSRTNISVALKNLNQILKRKAVIILISDFMDSNFEKAIKITEQKHDLIPVIVNDPLELELKNYPAILSYVNPENGEYGYVDMSDAYMVKRYNEEFKARRESLIKTFNSHNIDYMEINTQSDIFRTVVSFFKNRKLKIARGR